MLRADYIPNHRGAAMLSYNQCTYTNTKERHPVDPNTCQTI